MRVLLIEDDTRLADLTAEFLRGHDVEVEIAADGKTGLDRASSGEHDLVVLDIMLPEMDGLAVCRQLRTTSRIPIIMLTARGEEVDRIVGLELGADDYMPKPFSPRELLARMRAVLRRHQPEAAQDEGGDEQQVGALAIDRRRRTVAFDGQAVELTAHQFDLLWVLASRPGTVWTRAELHTKIRALRGEEPTPYDPSVDRSIDVQLSKVRQALSAVGGRDVIQTVRGVGYSLGGESA